MLQPIINIGFVLLISVMLWKQYQLESDLLLIEEFLNKVFGKGHGIKIEGIELSEDAQQNIKREIDKAIKEMSDEDEKGEE